MEETHLIVSYETSEDLDLNIFLHWEKAITVPAIVAAYLNITQIKNYNYINKLV